MNSKDFQFTGYTPAEFEQFRSAVQQDGFSITQNTIDIVAGHIGSLTYLTGKYNRNQQILTVTVKTSPWGSTQADDIKSNVLRVVNKSDVTPDTVNHEAVKTPLTKSGTVTTPPVASSPATAGSKNAVTPPPALTSQQATKVAEVLKQAAAGTPQPVVPPATPPVAKQTPVPAATTATTPPVEAATTTPTK